MKVRINTLFPLIAASAFISAAVMADDEPEACEASEPNIVSPSLFLNTSEAAGAKYRKIGLNGFPLPDEKPQQKEESDAEPEETYIDGFNHTLSHQVTDIYVPMQGTDLALNVRRNWVGEIWDRNGLGPAQRPDLPFGVGWSSNIVACLKTVSQKDAPPWAYVTDTNGVSYRFLVLRFFPGVTTDPTSDVNMKFLPMPENRFQQEVLATKLEQVVSDEDEVTYVFTNKYGTKLVFDELPGMEYHPGFGINSSPLFQISYPLQPYNAHNALEATVYRWARILEATDRYGTEMVYSYGTGNNTLIPNEISSRGKTLLISSANGRVTSITDPRGNETHYNYGTLSFSGTTAPYTSGTVSPYSMTSGSLESVVRPDETHTDYDYDLVSDRDTTPRDVSDKRPINYFYHIDLKAITDPLGNSFTFTFGFDRTRKAGMRTEFFAGWYTPSGMPRLIKTVSLPDGNNSHFQNNSKVSLSRDPSSFDWVISGSRSLNVIDTAGGNWKYDFTEGHVARMDEFIEMALPDPDPMSESITQLIFYEKMTVSTPEGGSMIAEFDRTAGMALKSFKDVGASAATIFEYNDDLNLNVAFPWISNAALAQIPMQKWGDPTKQTNGEGGQKLFEYQGTWRIMSKVTDEEGRETVYNLDPTNGNRLKETIKISSEGPVVQETNFSYENATFPGILTKKVVVSGSSDPGWATNLETRYQLDAGNGNVLKEFVGSGTSRVTEYTYDANNNKLSTKDANGHTTAFVYDDLNRLKEVDPPGAGKKVFTYDARGNKIAEEDENGNKTLRVYDNLNRVVKEVRDMNGNGLVDTGATSPDLITEFTYNGLNAKTSVKSPNGWTTSMTYDGLNRMVKSTDPYGKETLFEYGANSGGLQFGKDFLPTKVTDPRGFSTVATYDANNRPTEKKVQYAWSGTNPVYAVTQIEYDAVGNVIKETDPLNRETEKQYDALNREIRTEWADGSAVEAFYTRTGLKWKTVDELLFDTLTEYDDAGRPVKVSSPLVVSGTGFARAVTQSVYDPAGNVIETINPLGHSWEFEYDSRNRKMKEIRPGTGSPTIESVYDAVGNVVKTIDARGAETETTYDAANRPVEVKQPVVAVFGSGTARPTTATEYDRNGNAVKVTDANGHETSNTYDKLNRLVATEDAEGIIVENEYDEVGNKTAVIDGKEQRTEFAYDGLKRNTKITDAGGKETDFLFDAVNKTARVDALGVQTDYEYDLRHRLTKVSYKDENGDPVNTATNATREYAYDATGNLLAVTEAAKGGKADVAYSYDGLKRQLTETSGGLTHAYVYDLAGNRISCLYGGLSVPLVSTYDEQNRLTTLTQGTLVTAYTYDLNGNVLTRTLPNGDVATSTFDALNRTLSMVGMSGVSAPLYSYAYGYDAAGNVKQVTESYGNTALNRVVTNTYDAINRLTEEAVTGSGAATTTFSYDDAHNRETMVKSGTSTNYTYNSRNQLTSFTSGTNSVSFSYDDNGNRTERIQGGTTDTYGWDAENRLISLVKQSAGGTGTYGWGYDYRTRRVELAHAGNITKAVFSGGTSVRELENGVPTVDYVRGSDWGGGVGGILYSTRAGVPSFTHYNRRGDVTAKTDGTGTVTYQATYDAYGQRATETGATLDRQKSNTKDEDIPGYANEGFRFRDLETGIFLSKDPAGFVDGPNLYAYVTQNPWTFFDPEGLKKPDEHYKNKRANNKNIGRLNKRLEGAKNLSEKSKDGIRNQISGLERDNARIDKAINAIETSARALNERKNMQVKASELDDESALFRDGINAHIQGEISDAWNSVVTSFGQMLPGSHASNQAWYAWQSGNYANAVGYGLSSIGEAGLAVGTMGSGSTIMQGAQGIPTMSLSLTRGSGSVHAFYSVSENGATTWMHAAGMKGFPLATEVSPGLAGFTTRWNTISGIPILNPQAARAVGVPASNCVEGAGSALLRGWGLK